MKITTRDRAGIGLCIAASALGVVWARGPHAADHHSAVKAGTVTDYNHGPYRCQEDDPCFLTPATAPVAVSWPSTIILPDQLAQAIGQARENTAPGCHPHKAQAWAEIDENGHVLGMYAACASGTVKS